MPSAPSGGTANALSGIAMYWKKVSTSNSHSIVGFTNPVHTSQSDGGTTWYYISTIKLPNGGSWIVIGNCSANSSTNNFFLGTYSGGTTLNIATLTGYAQPYYYLLAWRYN